MKNNLFSNGFVVVWLITAGLTPTTSAGPQAHGHQHGDVFGRILHKSKASSASGLNITSSGAAHSRFFYAAISGVAVLIYTLDSVAVLHTATGIIRGSDCIGGICDSTNVPHHRNPFAHPTPVPKLQLQALKVQAVQLASLGSRRRPSRYRSSQTSGKDDASPTAELGPASTGTMSAKTSGTYGLTYRRLRS